MSLRNEAVVRAQNLGHRLNEWENIPHGSIAFCKKCSQGAQVQDKDYVVLNRKYLEGNAVNHRCTG
jgi:hypothetical protein